MNFKRLYWIISDYLRDCYHGHLLIHWSQGWVSWDRQLKKWRQDEKDRESKRVLK